MSGEMVPTPEYLKIFTGVSLVVDCRSSSHYTSAIQNMFITVAYFNRVNPRFSYMNEAAVAS